MCKLQKILTFTGRVVLGATDSKVFSIHLLNKYALCLAGLLFSFYKEQLHSLCLQNECINIFSVNLFSNYAF